jgi:ABC-type multidrug transport system, ATPase component
MVISLENVTKIFGKARVIDNVSVGFNSGELSVVVGDHGAGKSSLLRLLAGELKPDSGKVVVKTGDLRGFAYENSNFFPGLKTADLCTVWTLLYRGFDIKKFRSLLSEAGVAENSRISHLSDSMKSWFGSSLVLASNADIMIFDEPLQYLNSEIKARFIQLVENEAKEGKTVIVSSNEIADFEHSANFVAAFHNGSLVLAGQTEKLLSSHRLFPGASTISPDFKVIGPVLNERLIETEDNIGRKATLKDIVSGYINGSSS